ncbi:zf-TFIIB domain-containing protein [Oxalobacteraceae bacterium R-40]|uniref:Zf-TFIIB domain-containing protein n=1 Tax=Keguizhuia sedimenti TaxID=3064264 RepID=A0ABU1BTH5_9BURK|nr:zf-TFIIB domain-containing protein [Oxalobacteraceae bacterium R-40]
MKCPVCKETHMVMTERQNIEIDYCPQCRGIWLDRGELDKLIERSERESAAASPPQPAADGYPRQDGRYGESQFGHHGSKHGSSHGHGSGHKSFLKRLFD